MMEEKLPKGWKVSNLFDIAVVTTGRKDANFATEDGQYFFFTCALEPLKAPSYSFEGEVLLLPGNGANVGQVLYFNGKFEAYQRTYIVGNIKINPRFLYYYFLAFWNKVGVSTQYGSATNYIKIGNFKDFEIINPPLSEQQRIVAKLDALFGHLDSLREKLNGIPTLLKKFRQQVLTQAVTGELTKEWREGKGFTNNEGPIPIPNDWSFRQLKEISHSLKYGSSSKSENMGDVPVLRMGNIQDGEIDWSDLKYSSDSIEIEKYELTSGDLLFNRTNSPELVGKTAIYRGGRDAIYAGYLIQIKPKESVNSEFLNFVLNSNYSKKWCWEVKTDGVSQSNINAKKLGDFLVPVPSLEEQDEIVSKVNALFEISKRIESQYASLKAKIDQLPQAILAKAFRGELVSQEVKEYVVEEIEGLMAAEDTADYKSNFK